MIGAQFLTPYGYIYKLTNKVNGKNYIGQTTNRLPQKRITSHFKKGPSKQLTNRAVQKYGKENFSWELLFCCFDKTALDHFERQFIREYDCLAPNGYNLQLGGVAGEGKHSEATKLQLSKAKIEYYKHNVSPVLGTKRSKETKALQSRTRKGFDSPARKKAREKMHEKIRKSVKCIKIDTKEERIFKSIEDAAEALGLVSSCVSRVCRGDQNRTQHKGWQFQLINEPDQIPLTLPDRTYVGIRKNRHGAFVLVYKGRYWGSFKTPEDALQIKTLADQNLELAEQELKNFVKLKKLTTWTKRIKNLKTK